MEHHSLTAAWALPPHYHHQKEYCPIHCDVKSYYLSCYKSNCSFAPVELCCFDIGINSVQSLSCVRLFATPWTAAHQGSLSITNSWSLLKLMSIELVMPSNHLSLCRPLPLLPSIFPSIRIFSNESVLHIKWPKYWSLDARKSNQSILKEINPEYFFEGLILKPKLQYFGPVQLLLNDYPVPASTRKLRRWI